MSTSLRVFLVACAVIVFIFVVHNLKRCRMQVLDSVFWLLFSTSFVVLGVFPEIASFFQTCWDLCLNQILSFYML